MYVNQVALQTKGGLSYGNNPKYLILHHADMNGSVQAVNQVHLDEGFSMIGYNYYVRKDGSIWKGRPENAIGANCYNYNSKSISICAEGNFMTDIMSSAQKQSIIELGRDILNRLGQQLIVCPHSRLYNTDCPGINYPLVDIIAQINNPTLNITPTVTLSQPIIKEVLKVKNIVVVSNDIDQNAGNYLSYFLQCPIIRGDLPFDYGTVENVYGVGSAPVTNGIPGWSGYVKKVFSGDGRYDTMQKVLDFIKAGCK